MQDAATPGRMVGELKDNCFDIQLAKGDLALFRLDNGYILLELRPDRNDYGAFYTAKGRQWDLWSDPEESADQAVGVSFAVREPVKAAVELLSRRWRPDFDYDPDEED
jgi:hypothetical protein